VYFFLFIFYLIVVLIFYFVKLLNATLIFTKYKVEEFMSELDLHENNLLPDFT